MEYFEYEYEPGLFLSGNVKELDDSFDHAFGTEVRVSYEVTNFKIKYCIAIHEFDITSIVQEQDQKVYFALKEALADNYMEQEAGVYRIV